MQYNKNFLFSFFFSLYSLFISFYLYDIYIEGDLQHYSDFYNSLQYYTFLEGYEFYRSRLGASEPVYYLLVSLSNNFISKNIFFSILNGLFGFTLSYLLLKRGFHPLLLFLMGINFYFLVLLGPAERLKISLLFFLLSIWNVNSRKSFVFLLLSLLSHFQIFILLFARFSNSIKLFFKSAKLNRIGKTFSAIILVLLFSVLLYLFKTPIEDKFMGYSEEGGIEAIVKPLIFLLLTLFYSKKRFEMFIMQIPIVLAAYLIGESRLVILSFGIFVYVSSQYRRGINIGMLGSLLYFAYKGLEFFSNVELNGEAF